MSEYFMLGQQSSRSVGFISAFFSHAAMATRSKWPALDISPHLIVRHGIPFVLMISLMDQSSSYIAVSSNVAGRKIEVNVQQLVVPPISV